MKLNFNYQLVFAELFARKFIIFQQLLYAPWHPIHATQNNLGVYWRILEAQYPQFLGIWSCWLTFGGRSLFTCELCFFTIIKKLEKNKIENITTQKLIIQNYNVEYINTFILEFINSYIKDICLDFYLGFPK